MLGGLSAAAEQIAARSGVTRIDHADDEALADFGPDRHVAALAAYSQEHRPHTIVFSQTDESRLVAARLAARLDAGVVMNAVDIGVDGDGLVEVTATAYGGDVRAVYVFEGGGPCIVALTPGAVTPAPMEVSVPAPPVRPVALELGGVAERVTVVQPASASGPRLEDARVVVAGGRGLGAAEHFRLVERLAAALGGLPAASRAIVDDGWAGPMPPVKSDSPAR